MDATFAEERHLQAFTSMAEEEGVLLCCIECRCDREVVRRRLEQRKVSDEVSDAGWEVYESMEKKWRDAMWMASPLLDLDTNQDKSLLIKCAHSFLKLHDIM